MHVLDTSVLLQGGSPPPGPCCTTPEAEAEVTRGGKDAKRFSYWKAAGLTVRAAGAPSFVRVGEVAGKAGNLARLSAADISVLALAHELGATLWSDDNTVLDVAQRLNIAAESVRDGGIDGTVDWKLRCAGCGKWFETAVPDCPICGSEVRLRPQ